MRRTQGVHDACRIDAWRDAQQDRVSAWCRAMLVVITIAMFAVVVRVWTLKTNPDPRLAKAAGAVTSSSSLLARRGDLVDRRGRIIATSTLGYRLFVDPEVVEDVDTVAVEIARITRLDPAALDQKIFRRPDSRYIVLAETLDDWQVSALREAGIPGVGLEPKLIRHYPHGDVGAGLIGLTGREDTGLAGFEHSFNDHLTPHGGQLTYWRDVSRKALWVEPEGYKPSRNGHDVQLSIDLVIQGIAEKRLRQAIARHNAGGGRIVVLNPHTGEILAMCDELQQRDGWEEQTTDKLREQHPGLGRNRCVTDPYEPGSTFKPFIWAAATQDGLSHIDEILNTPAGPKHRTSQGRRIADDHYYAKASWRKVLVKSINSGMAIVAERMSDARAQSIVRDFGFGHRTNCGIPGETIGLVTSPARWSHYTQTSIAMGHEIGVTPVQMVRAFSAFACDGMIPSLRVTVSNEHDDVTVVRRVIDADTARLTRSVMRDVMLEGTGRPAQSSTYRMFGKSGTAQLPIKQGGGYHEDRYVSSFIAGAPLNDPQLVVLCVIDDPDKSVAEHGGGRCAGPVVRDVMDASLAYLGVQPDHPDAQDIQLAAAE